MQWTCKVCGQKYFVSQDNKRKTCSDECARSDFEARKKINYEFRHPK